MRTSTIHGNSIRSREVLHDVLESELELPPHYGRNLDALWDCLSAWVDFPLEVRWLAFSATRRHLGEHADRLLTLLQRADQDLEGFHLHIEE